MDEDRFAYLVCSSDGSAHIDLIGPDDAERIAEMLPGEPSDDPYYGLLLDGVLYGPDTWGAVHAAMQRLPRGAFAMGMTETITEGQEVRDRRPLSDLVERFAAPGEAIGDPDA